MKSRAKRMMETCLREDSADLQAQPQGTAGPDKATQPGGSMGAGEPQPTDNHTGSPDLQKLMAECMHPEGMAHMAEAAGDMMDRYMDADDKETYTPKDDAEKEACEAAKYHFGEAASHMRKMNQ